MCIYTQTVYTERWMLRETVRRADGTSGTMKTWSQTDVGYPRHYRLTGECKVKASETDERVFGHTFLQTLRSYNLTQQSTKSIT